MMNTWNNSIRKWLNDECKKFRNPYTHLVAPVNRVLDENNIGLDKETAEAIKQNITNYHNGTQSLRACNLSEVSLFFQAGQRLWQQGNHREAAVSYAGSLLNLLAYGSVAAAEDMRQCNIMRHTYCSDSFGELGEPFFNLSGLPFTGTRDWFK